MEAINASYSLACGRVGDQTTFFPLKNEAGFVLNEANPIPETLYISGADCFKPDVFVQTTRTHIKELMDMTTKNDAKIIFPQVWGALKNTNTDTVYARGGEEWDNFMEDILIYYVCRFKLFGTPMPSAFAEGMPQLSESNPKTTVSK
jgi:hypothetical protein